MAASIEPFLRMRAAALVGHLPSGELAYLSDHTGSLQLYVARADGLHDQLTFGENRVTGATRSRIDERIVIARDAGGNERHALACLDAVSGRELALTHDPEAIHSLGAFAPDGSTFAFTHTERNGVDFDLALVGLDGSGRRELAQLEGVCSVCDWSESGILLWRMNTPFDHDLFLVDPVTGGLEHLTPHEGETAYESPRLLADGLVACACDAGGQFTRLTILAPGAAPEFRTPDDADIDHVRVDGTRTHIAHVLNRGGPSELWLDGMRLEGLPRGVYGPPELALDGRIALTVAALADTTDVWSVPGPRPTDPLGFRRRRSRLAARARGARLRELRRTAHPLPPVRRDGPADRLLRARRPGVAVPRVAEPGRRRTSSPAASRSPLRTCAARRATGATTTTSTTSSCGSTRCATWQSSGARWEPAAASRSPSWAAATAAT